MSGSIHKLDHLIRDSQIVDEAARRQKRRSQGWQVIHASEFARDVANVVDAQLAAGMHPYVITAKGGTRQGRENSASLMQAWQDVRTWRKQFDQCSWSMSPMFSSAILHAHSFTSGMAGVRGEIPVVYDLRTFVEEQAIGSGECGEKSWLSRSFRTAEQFVLTRAAAVVVHASSMRSSCLERGVDAKDIFVIPDPVSALPLSAGRVANGSNWIHRIFGFSQRDAVAIVARIDGLADGHSEELSTRHIGKEKPRTSAGDLLTLLQAFAQAHSENELTRLFVITEDGAEKIREIGRQLNLDHAIFMITPVDAACALESADIVLDMATDRRHAGRDCVAITAMIHGRALLAPDVSQKRDLTPEGRGCLWYKPSDKKDLAHRLAFLARNHDFRKALGESGRKYIMETRTPERVGQLYADVYRHAHARRKKSSDSQDLSASLIPTQACL